MSHTPTKFVTRPHLVTALFYDGSAKGRDALAEFLGAHCREGGGGYALVWNLIIPADFWVVRGGDGVKIKSPAAFEAQYEALKEELKDYPVEIINP